MKKIIKKIISKTIPPSATFNINTANNFRKLRKLLERNSLKPKLLIIGGGIEKHGKYMCVLGNEILSNSVNLEICLGKIVDVVGDGHKLPFSDSIFDAVILQGVLEHTYNSEKVVSEAKRVLRKGGYIYAEIPFLQSYHGSPHDYRRYTIEGIEVLFSDFLKIDKGIANGPSSAINLLLVQYLAILFSFNVKKLYSLFSRFFGWILFPLKYLDIILAKYSKAYLVSSGFYFLGKK